MASFKSSKDFVISVDQTSFVESLAPVNLVKGLQRTEQSEINFLWKLTSPRNDLSSFTVEGLGKFDTVFIYSGDFRIPPLPTR